MSRLAGVVLLLAGCSVSVSVSVSAGVAAPQSTAAAPSAPLIVAAGDIQCGTLFCDTSDSAGTSNYVASIINSTDPPTAALELGDTQYPPNTSFPPTLLDYLLHYNVTWGRFRNISRPAIGNHECGAFKTAAQVNSDPCLKADAPGYYSYFGVPEYYAYNVGAWRLYALNSEIRHAAGSPQLAWFRRDTTAHPRTCTLAYWHRPRWSSGEHGDDASYRAMWRAMVAAGVDVVLNGHDHDYERFARRNGTREFVVGTGGRSIQPWGTPSTAHSQTRHLGFGVLRLRLHPAAYNWRFVSTDTSAYTDTGYTHCSR